MTSFRIKALLSAATLAAAAADGQQPDPPDPDVRAMCRESFDHFAEGAVACGWEALRHRRRGNINRSNPGTLDGPRLTQFERPVRGDPDDVAAVNREMVEYCRRKQAEVEEAWGDPKRRLHPDKLRIDEFWHSGTMPDICSEVTYFKETPRANGLPAG